MTEDSPSAVTSVHQQRAPSVPVVCLLIKSVLTGLLHLAQHLALSVGIR